MNKYFQRSIFFMLFNGGLSLTILGQTPVITSFDPAIGPPGTLVTITGTNFSGLISLSVGGASAILISNTGTQIVGYVMPGTTTGPISVTTASGTGSSGSNFSVTSSAYPNMQLGSKLVGTGSVGPEIQGTSVSVSADGKTAIIGAQQDNTYMGAAWIFTRSGSTWTQQGTKLVGTGSVGVPYQGCAVSISADGNTAIVGGYNDNAGKGAAWVFTRTGGTWTQQGSKLVGTGSIGSEVFQGTSVAISADGNTAIVGGIKDNFSQGAAWIFTRSGGTWTQQGSKLLGSGSSGSNIFRGSAVALSADGNTALIGGQRDNADVGAIWIFTRSAGVWTQEGSKLVGTGGGGQQGTAAALSADGNTAIVGGPLDNAFKGAVWIFSRSGGVWTQQGGKLVATGSIGPNERQGRSVALSADGNSAIVGSHGDDTDQGGAWVYTRSGGIWSQQGGKLLGTGNIGAAAQGYAVALSANGSIALSGGIFDNSAQGATWVFGSGSVLPISAGSLSASEITGGQVKLQWKVFDEAGMSHYEVERSANGSDFLKKSESVMVRGLTEYTWLDRSPQKGMNLYRIKALYESGKIEYSNIASLRMNNEGGIVSIRPNPIWNNKIGISVTNSISGDHTFRILNTSGQTIHNSRMKYRSGNMTYTIVLPANTESGIYFLEISYPDLRKETQKLIINH